MNHESTSSHNRSSNNINTSSALFPSTNIFQLCRLVSSVLGELECESSIVLSLSALPFQDEPLWETELVKVNGVERSKTVERKRPSEMTDTECNSKRLQNWHFHHKNSVHVDRTKPDCPFFLKNLITHAAAEINPCESHASLSTRCNQVCSVMSYTLWCHNHLVKTRYEPGKLKELTSRLL